MVRYNATIPVVTLRSNGKADAVGCSQYYWANSKLLGVFCFRKQFEAYYRV